MKKQPKPDSPELSIIILSYNVSELLVNCLESIYKFDRQKLARGDWEIIVPDNNSNDDTLGVLKKKNYPGLRVIENSVNMGFAAGNNIAAKASKGKYILFLNPDTIVEPGAISYCLSYLQKNPEVGAATVEVVLGNGKPDTTAHRGFPTPWNSLCYFSGLSKIFPKSKLFSGYTLGHLDLKTEHVVDAINGAFFMIPRTLGERLGWFDEDFFWKGEDLDLCYRINELGYKIMYLPGKKIIHFKGSSRGHVKGSKTLGARFDVMRLFYEKHYRNKYPRLIKELVFAGIKIKEILTNAGL